MKKNKLYGIIAALVLIFVVWRLVLILTSSSIEVVHPVRGPAVRAVYATGTVEASVMMPIAARSPSRLMELNVDEGIKVTKGQVLGRLEDDDLQQSVEELEARENFTREDYERKSGLAQHNYTAKSVSDQALADWNAAKAQLSKAQASLSYMKLIAPADGLIIKRDGEIGELIPANQPVFWLTCCAPLRISSEVDEEDISLVKPDQAVVIRADAFPGKIFHGKVQAITPKGDPVARSYRVRIEFTEEVPLQIGMTAETNIIISEHKDALLVPVTAVKKDKLWLVKDGHLAEQPVTIGAKGLDQVEISEGVTAEDEVVAKPTSLLKADQRVRSKLIEQPK